MRLLRICLCMSLLQILSSCIAPGRDSLDHVPASLYDISITYDKHEMAFTLKLISHANEAICISRMSWPSEKGGHYFSENEEVLFVNRGIQYRVKNLGSSHCTASRKNGCVYRLRKNQGLIGKLRITDFMVEPDIYLDTGFSPELQYPYSPSFCR